jgi:hypothetical protein
MREPTAARQRHPDAAEQLVGYLPALGMAAEALVRETAMAVCYVRAFTKSTLGTLSPQYLPVTPPYSDLHAWFRERKTRSSPHG